MITEMSRNELAALGRKQRASYLVQQGGYTLGLAAAEEDEIEAILEDTEVVENVSDALDKVRAATQNRELMAQESKDLTRRQNEKLRAAKVWRRKVVARAKRAQRRGKEIPEELLVIGRARSVPDVIAQITIMTALFEAHLADMGGARARALLDEGKTILDELSAADAEQEVARLARLPEKTVDFYAAKGLLYVGLKLINDAGHELHADDPPKAAEYNLKILYRQSRRNRSGGGGDGGSGGDEG